MSPHLSLNDWVQNLRWHQVVDNSLRQHTLTVLLCCRHKAAAATDQAAPAMTACAALVAGIVPVCNSSNKLVRCPLACCACRACRQLTFAGC